jgi:hypothetical protein
MMTFDVWRALGLKYQRFNEVLRRRAQEILAAAKADPSPESTAQASAALTRLQARQQRHTARLRRHMTRAWDFVPVSGKPS